MEIEMNEEEFLSLDYLLNHSPYTYLQKPKSRNYKVMHSQIPIEASKAGFLWIHLPNV